ncbi:unnamed protein product [Dovyalis caffra]|uniref:Uncharacterized protein n=1 Tax=Dovyalis caffra TaxID=77055 RepID=A0AAV1QMB0_9ROSI|nr:unnamed protein product [Dovyalis caffra]
MKAIGFSKFRYFMRSYIDYALSLIDNFFRWNGFRTMGRGHQGKMGNAPTRAYMHDAKAIASTPANVKEYTNSYAFIIDMPGLKLGDIKGS